MSGRSSGPPGPSGGQGGSGKPPWIPSGSGGLSHNAFAKASIQARQQQLAPAPPALQSPMAVPPAAQDAALSPMTSHPSAAPPSQAASPQLSTMPASVSASASASQQRAPLTPMQSARARANWKSAVAAARALTTGEVLLGAVGPPSEVSPNAVYQRADHSGSVVQNTIYNQHGLAIAQVDFKQHGKGAPPGHSHRTATPGDIASAHGASGGSTVHYTPESTPEQWKRKQF